MYVLVMDRGYVEIVQSENKSYELENHREYSLSTELTIKGHKRTIHLIPIGSIVMNQFNQNWDNYKKEGGSRTEALHKNTISLIPPYCPTWIFPDEKPVEYDLYNFEFADLPYIPMTYITVNGKLRELFQVDKLSDLYFYDLFRLKENKNTVKQCKECGHAFIANTRAIVCDECRKAGKIEERKRKNLMGDETRKKFHQIKQRNAQGKRPCTYSKYYADICRLISNHIDSDNKNDLKQFALQLDSLDRKYFKLCQYFASDICYCDEEILEKWQQKQQEFLYAPDMETWLKAWYKKAMIPYS